MRRGFTCPAGLLPLALMPGVAHAQHLSPLLVATALSPLLVFLLAIILGIVARSWKTGVMHAGLIVIWVLLFGVASYWVENDYIIWTPVALYSVHALVIVALLIVGIAKRLRGAG
jgi:MFS-type transporter involved in bile tolerance (Atg22 family)